MTPKEVVEEWVRRFNAGDADGLSGVEVLDDHTVRISLSRPDATFLHVMALNFASVVPKEAVEEHGADFGTNPVGTGAFKMTDWTRGQHVVFERNPDYYQKGLPRLDKITFEVGQEPIVALLRLERGEVDIAGDGIPPAKFLQTMNDPKFKDQIVEGKQLHTGYVTMNVKMKPFDDVRVRKAVAMAINKDRIVRIINGRAVPANQPLPPLMPGYDTEYQGQAYDVEGAKALLAEAGLGDGFETELYVANTDPQPRIAQAIQQDLCPYRDISDVLFRAHGLHNSAFGERPECPGRSVDRWTNASVSLRACLRARRWPRCAGNSAYPGSPATRSTTATRAADWMVWVTGPGVPIATPTGCPSRSSAASLA